MNEIQALSLLKLILEKKVDLKLVAWASPSVEAYNNNVNEKGWVRPLLTNNEFQSICEYAKSLNIKGYDTKEWGNND